MLLIHGSSPVIYPKGKSFIFWCLLGLFLLGTPAFNLPGPWERSWTWCHFLGGSQALLLECTARFLFPHLKMVKQMLVRAVLRCLPASPSSHVLFWLPSSVSFSGIESSSTFPFWPSAVGSNWHIIEIYSTTIGTGIRINSRQKTPANLPAFGGKAPFQRGQSHYLCIRPAVWQPIWNKISMTLWLCYVSIVVAIQHPQRTVWLPICSGSSWYERPCSVLGGTLRPMLLLPFCWLVLLSKLLQLPPFIGTLQEAQVSLPSLLQERDISKARVRWDQAPLTYVNSVICAVETAAAVFA